MMQLTHLEKQVLVETGGEIEISVNRIGGLILVPPRKAIATVFSQLSPDFRLEIIEDCTDPSKTALAIYNRGELSIADQLKLDDRILVPQKREFGGLKYIRLPKGVVPYESVRSLIAQTTDLLRGCADIESTKAELIAAFVLSTWIPEKLPVAPYLAFIGTPRSGKTTMLRLLSKLCRHALLVTDVTSAGFYQPYEQTTPTLLIDEALTAGDWKKISHLLRAGSTPDCHALRRNSVLNCFGPKAFACIELPRDEALVTRCIVIPMSETDRTNFKPVSDPKVEALADDLQRKFLQYRLEMFNAAPCMEDCGLHSRSRDLYLALTHAIGGEKQLCASIAQSLKQQDQFTREALSRSQVAVLAVLMLIAHWPEDSTILIGELTDFANRFISKKLPQLTAHAVGRILGSFGMQSTKRTNRGWVLVFDDDSKRNVHKLIKRYGIEYPVFTPIAVSRLSWKWKMASIR
jgi:hypothetical protein